MARDFEFNQYLTVSYPVALPRSVTTTPLTLACWFNSDDLTPLGQVMVFLGNIGSQSDGWWIGLNGDGTVAALTTSGNLASHDEAHATASWTTGTWHHACGVFASATSRTSYLNGGNPGTNTTSITPAAAITGISIGAAHTGSPYAFVNGRLAEVGLWDIALTAAEVASLGRGISPLLVRPQNLRAYWPLIGRASPDVELMQGLSVDPINSPGTSPHCRVYYPSVGFVPSLAAGEAPPLEVSPPVVSNPFTIFAPTVIAGLGLAPPTLNSAFQIFAPTIAAELGLSVPLVSITFAVFAPTITVTESALQEDSQSLEPHNLRVRLVSYVSGDDLRITRLYTGLPGGIVINKAYLTVKRLATDIDASAILQKQITATLQMSGQITDAITTGGSIQLYFDLMKTETDLLQPLVPFQYDIRVITSGNAAYTCEKGVIVMQQGVTATNS